MIPRDRIAVALDLDEPDAAVALARRVEPWVGVAKVGHELWAAAGPAIVDRLHDIGMAVFCDLKYHDIPTTVHRAARVIGRLGARYLNMHAAGGVAMLRAGVEGLAEGAKEASVDLPVALAVTVLTSDADASAFADRLECAIESGCGGVVCSAHEIAAVRVRAPEFVTVVPGIRLPGGDTHDQARIATPQDALQAGASVIVVGRALTRADDPAAVAAGIAASRSVGTGA
jgi:orotidine-5'-phosphate decarboxylase